MPVILRLLGAYVAIFVILVAAVVGLGPKVGPTELAILTLIAIGAAVFWTRRILRTPVSQDLNR